MLTCIWYYFIGFYRGMNAFAVHMLFSYVFCGHLRLWFFYLSSFAFICKLMNLNSRPPKDRHHEKPETSTHRGASLQLPRREPRVLGKLVCKESFCWSFQSRTLLAFHALPMLRVGSSKIIKHLPAWVSHRNGVCRGRRDVRPAQ